MLNKHKRVYSTMSTYQSGKKICGKFKFKTNVLFISDFKRIHAAGASCTSCVACWQLFLSRATRFPDVFVNFAAVHMRLDVQACWHKVSLACHQSQRLHIQIEKLDHLHLENRKSMFRRQYTATRTKHCIMELFVLAPETIKKNHKTEEYPPLNPTTHSTL